MRNGNMSCWFELLGVRMHVANALLDQRERSFNSDQPDYLSNHYSLQT